MFRTLWLLLLIVGPLLISVFALLSLLSKRPTNLGVADGRLVPCPNSPNCVSTQAADREHHIDSVVFTGSSADAMAKLRSAVSSLPRTRIVSETPNYMHVECTTFFFRYIDDLECYVDDATKTIHFRSASRAGRSDLGVNRARVESIQRRFKAS